tara:strand:- start:387 stop:1433 length:1047 start_codon:yes stop_codon:yes gene_type:complete
MNLKKTKENISSKCKINKISEISKEKLLPFYKRLFPARCKSLTENWNWWYRVNKDFAEPVILSLDGRVIGQAAFLVNNLKVSNKKISAIWGQDYAVLPEYMGFGLGKLLWKEWMKVCPNQMALCSSSSLVVLKKFGFIDNFETKRLLKPINYFKLIPYANNLNLNLLNSTLRFFLKKRYTFNESIKPYNLSENFKTLSESFNLKQIPENPDNFPIINRDESWLAWRLMECPYKKDIYYFEYKNNFSIVHIYFAKKIKRLNILYTYSTDGSENVKLYKLIASWAINNNIDFMWAISKNQNLKSIFPKVFYRPLRFAARSTDSEIFNVLKKGFLDLQGIDSDIESAFYLE